MVQTKVKGKELEGMTVYKGTRPLKAHSQQLLYHSLLSQRYLPKHHDAQGIVAFDIACLNCFSGLILPFSISWSFTSLLLCCRIDISTFLVVSELPDCYLIVPISFWQVTRVIPLLALRHCKFSWFRACPLWDRRTSHL